MTSDADLVHMRRAIALARTHVGLTGENPSVGCVLVKDGVIVGCEFCIETVDAWEEQK